ncbi:MAG: AAA family ATPase [Chloroflexi bacterium]|nr:AAA family ATPase [Chloroflexota bacterium]
MTEARSAGQPDQGERGTPTSLVQALLDPCAYPHPVESIDLVQTHISYIFLTGNDVYKVKKPVDFGFLDFTTLEKRRHFCHEEVRLNRRLSPATYLGVVEINRRGETYHVGGQGEVVEYAVHMRQLPRERMLDALLRRDAVTPDMVRRLAEKVVDFHRRAEASAESARYGGAEAVRCNWQENFTQTEKYIGVTITERQYRETRDYASRVLDERQALMESRRAQGRVRDCHGDLHAAQICFTNGIEVIDCIEFNERFRCCDVASEIAFLAMDLDFHGRRDLSRLWVDAYGALSGDAGLQGLLDFYKCYLAYVRGKVASFQMDSPHVDAAARARAQETARRYFDLAYSYTRPRGRPALFITTGLVGTGKTTLAHDVAERLGVRVISSDVVRKELAAIPPTERRFEPFDRGIYSPEMTAQTYDALFAEARRSLAAGQSVILDASFRLAHHRKLAAALAEGMSAEFFVLEAVCPEAVIMERLQKRVREGRSPSDGRPEIYAAQKRSYDPVAEADSAHHLVVDTSRPRERAVDDVLRRLPLDALAGVKG